MSDFLYDRMSRRVQKLVLLGMGLLYFSILVAIVYVVVHFVSKFW